MAFSLTQRPDAFSAAYLPMVYKGTSNRSPNTRSQEIDTSSTIAGVAGSTSGSVVRGERILVYADLQYTESQFRVGAYVLFENAGQYNGVHRISEIIQGASNFTSISQFYVETVVNQDTGVPLNSQLTALVTPGSVTVSQYYNNYSAILDLYISGNFVTRFRKKVNLDNEFVFDVSSVVQEYLGSDLYTLDSTTLDVASTDLSKEVYVEYGHEYDIIKPDGTTELTISVYGDDSANSFYAVNSVIPYIGMNDFSVFSTNYDMSDYAYTDTGNEQKFLTNQPYTTRIQRDSNYSLSYVINAETIGGGTPIGNCEVRLYVRTYNSSGATIATNQTVLENDTLANLKGTRAVLVGTTNLGAWITSETVKYDCYITLYNVITGNSRLTEIKEFEIDDTCYRDEYRFEWVNKLGGLDAFTFTGRYDKTSDIDKETFKRSLNDVRSIPERQLTTLTVNSEDIHTVNSGIVSKAERDWLEELLESPEVYLIKDGYRLPVHIDTKFGFEKLGEDSFNVTCEFRLAFDKITQRN